MIASYKATLEAVTEESAAKDKAIQKLDAALDIKSAQLTKPGTGAARQSACPVAGIM